MLSFKKKFACLLGLLLSLMSVNSFSSQKTLANFDELLQALDSGNKVSGVIHFDKCKLESGGGIPKTFTFGFTFDYYNHYNLPIDNQHSIEVISTTKNIFSITKINDLGSVNNYIQLHIMKDNTARMFGAILDPKNYDQKIFINYTCPISSDATQAGLMLYNHDA